MKRSVRISLSVAALLLAGFVGFFLGVYWHVGIMTEAMRGAP